MNTVVFLRRWSAVLCVLSALAFSSCAKDSGFPDDNPFGINAMAENGELQPPGECVTLTTEAQFAREFHTQSLKAMKLSLVTNATKSNPITQDVAQSTLNNFLDNEGLKKDGRYANRSMWISNIQTEINRGFDAFWVVPGSFKVMPDKTIQLDNITLNATQAEVFGDVERIFLQSETAEEVLGCMGELLDCGTGFVFQAEKDTRQMVVAIAQSSIEYWQAELPEWSGMSEEELYGKRTPEQRKKIWKAILTVVLADVIGAIEGAPTGPWGAVGGAVVGSLAAGIGVMGD